MKTLQPRQALSAVSDFLELYRSRNSWREDFIGDLLSDMQLCEDGSTLDPGAWHDWLKAVRKVTGRGEDAALTSHQALQAMELFVGEYGARINDAPEVTDFLNTLRPLSVDRRNEWLACVGKVVGAKN